jgi:hypothetical protein
MANRIVTKALAGIEDLLLGTGSVVQTRNGVSKTINKIDAAGLIYENAETLRTRFGKKVEVLDNVAALQLLPTATAAEKYVYLLGYTTPGDGGGGLFWLDSSDTTSVEDLNIVFNPDVVANGRWKRAETDDHMSPDRGDADYTITAFDFGIQRYSTALTADRTVTLPASGLYKGKKVSVIRTVGGSYNILIGAVATLTGSGLVEVQYDGSAWVVITSTSDTTDPNAFNGDFELDSNGDGIPDNWTVNELTNATIAIDKVNPSEGLNCVKMLSGGNGGGTITSPRFNVTTGHGFTVMFDILSSHADTLNTVIANYYDKAGTYIDSRTIYTNGTTNRTTDWEHFRLFSFPSIIGGEVSAELVFTGIDAASTTKTAGAFTNFDNIIVPDHQVSTHMQYVSLYDVADAPYIEIFDELPIWVNEVIITLDGVQAAATQPLSIEVGYAVLPAISQTGWSTGAIYRGGITLLTTGANTQQSWSGEIRLNNPGSTQIYGSITFRRISPMENSWEIIYQASSSGGNVNIVGSGEINYSRTPSDTYLRAMRLCTSLGSENVTSGYFGVEFRP